MTRKTYQYQRGFSLVEVVVALALSSLLSLILFEVFKTARESFTQIIDSNDMLDSAQLNLSLLQDSINMAGFWSGTDGKDLHLLSHHLSVFPGECNSAWVLNVKQSIEGFDGRENSNDIKALPKGCLSKDYVPYSDVLVIRRASTIDTVQDLKLDNKYYEKRFVVRGGPGAQGVVFQGKDSDEALDTVPYSPLVTNRLLSVDMFFLEYCTDFETCEDSGVGLSRYTLAGNRFVKQRLVNGVAQMQFEYGVDVAGDGLVEQYLAADHVTDWHRVLSVRVFALHKGSVKVNGYNIQDSELKLGGNFEFQVSEQNRRYKYKKFQSEFSLKNFSANSS